VTNDRLKDSVGLPQNLGIPEAHDPVTTRVEVSGALRVLGNLSFMLTAIDLDDELYRVADEVREVRTDRLLAAEFVAAEAPPAEVPPEPIFSRRGIAAVRPGEISG
jgi:hypothetical protein